MKSLLKLLGRGLLIVIQLILAFWWISLIAFQGDYYSPLDPRIILGIGYSFSLGLSIYWLVKKELKRGIILFFVNMAFLAYIVYAILESLEGLIPI